MIKTLIKKLAPILPSPKKKRFSTLHPKSANGTNLNELTQRASMIPGMLSEEAGRFLYALAFTQQLKGDVVEIGSWQGYSTTYLGQAVKDSGNGSLFAIDHFKGNKGKAAHYQREKEDLSDLKDFFIKDMKRQELAETVNLLDMTSREARDQLNECKLRLLFIDGDHSKKGVSLDYELFSSLLLPGALVIFDDYGPHAPGVIEVANSLVDRGEFDRVYTFHNTLVARR